MATCENCTDTRHETFCKHLAGLKSPTVYERYYAALNIYKAPRDMENDVVQALSDTAANDTSSQVRAIAVSSLGEIGSEKAFESIEESLDDPDILVKQQAIKAMQHSTSPNASKKMEQAYATISDAETRRLIAESLGKLGSPASEDFLKDVFQNDRSADVKEAAFVALGKINPSASADLYTGYVTGDIEVKSSSADRVAAAMAHHSWNVFDELVERGDEEAVRTLKRIVRNTAVGEPVYNRAVRASSKLGPTMLKDLVHAQAATKKQSIREEARRAIDEILKEEEKHPKKPIGVEEAPPESHRDAAADHMESLMQAHHSKLVSSSKKYEDNFMPPEEDGAEEEGGY